MKSIFYLALFCCFFYTACNKNQSTENEEAAMEAAIPAEPVDTFFAIMVNDLRMRDEPNLKSNVVTKLKIETEVLYLNKRSEFTEKISIGGSIRDEPWYEVTTRDGKFSGWVYGGGIQLIDVPINPEEKLSAERLVYAIDNGLKENLETIFKLTLPGESNRFKGFYEYKPGLAGNRILDGNFRLETRYLIEDYNLEAEVHIQGRYRNGKKDGAFTCRSYFPESETVATLYFEESQEKCIWGSYHGHAEDTQYSYREDQPGRCDFDYLREQADSQ